MKKVLTIILMVVCLILTINFSGLNNAQASSKSVVQTNQGNKCLFIFVRVQEGSRFFIYVYTEGGTYIMKYEDL